MAASPEAGRPHRRRKHRVLRIVGIVVVLLLVVAVGAGYLFYRHLDQNIQVEQTLQYKGRPQQQVAPSAPQQPMNILLLGSDTRQGQTGKHIGGLTPGLSDTAIVLHVSADRSHAYGVSIPRDSEVQIPSCPRKDGSGTYPGGVQLFNAAYAIGGARCSAKTVETLTGVRMDHFVVIDFNGFRDVVNALGGVKICVPRTVNDTQGHIFLKGGTYDVSGEKALDYVRIRDYISPNGDLGRIARQQAFLSSMIDKVSSAGTLANPVKLSQVLNAATSSISTDPGLDSVAKLVSLALQLKNIDLHHVKFVTVPTEDYPPNPAHVQWVEPAAQKLWNRIKNDQPLHSKQVGHVTSPGKKKPQSQTAAEKAKAYAAANGLCYPPVTG